MIGTQWLCFPSVTLCVHLDPHLRPFFLFCIAIYPSGSCPPSLFLLNIYHDFLIILIARGISCDRHSLPRPLFLQTCNTRRGSRGSFKVDSDLVTLIMSLNHMCSHSRFILNLPDEELASLERICFQVEQAYGPLVFLVDRCSFIIYRHWFYEDFIREENPKFPSLPLKKFSAMLFHACPLLHHWSHDHEQAFNTFMQYKTRVPVCGAIMLNDTWEKVRSFHSLACHIS